MSNLIHPLAAAAIVALALLAWGATALIDLLAPSRSLHTARRRRVVELAGQVLSVVGIVVLVSTCDWQGPPGTFLAGIALVALPVGTVALRRHHRSLSRLAAALSGASLLTAILYSLGDQSSPLATLVRAVSPEALVVTILFLTLMVTSAAAVIGRRLRLDERLATDTVAVLSFRSPREPDQTRPRTGPR